MPIRCGDSFYTVGGEGGKVTQVPFGKGHPGGGGALGVIPWGGFHPSVYRRSKVSLSHTSLLPFLMLLFINFYDPIKFPILSCQQVFGDGSDSPLLEIDGEAVAARCFGTVQFGKEKYREYLYHAGGIGKRGKAKISKKVLEEVVSNDFELGRIRKLRYPSRYFTDSGIIGSNPDIS